MYNQIHEREGEYIREFYEIYNKKCSYCGAKLGLLPIECFEIDHFINEASFSDDTNGRAEAGKIENLVLSCTSCNRKKKNLEIDLSCRELLNVDNGNIATVFVRSEEYYININEKFKDNIFINRFYNELHLGYETRRLDYLALLLDERRKRESDSQKQQQLGDALSIILKRRNEITVNSKKREYLDKDLDDLIKEK